MGHGCREAAIRRHGIGSRLLAPASKERLMLILFLHPSGAPLVAVCPSSDAAYGSPLPFSCAVSCSLSRAWRHLEDRREETARRGTGFAIVNFSRETSPTGTRPCRARNVTPGRTRFAAVACTHYRLTCIGSVAARPVRLRRGEGQCCRWTRQVLSGASGRFNVLKPLPSVHGHRRD